MVGGHRGRAHPRPRPDELCRDPGRDCARALGLRDVHIHGHRPILSHQWRLGHAGPGVQPSDCFAGVCVALGLDGLAPGAEWCGSCTNIAHRHRMDTTGPAACTIICPRTGPRPCDTERVHCHPDSTIIVFAAADEQHHRVVCAYWYAQNSHAYTRTPPTRLSLCCPPPFSRGQRDKEAAGRHPLLFVHDLVLSCAGPRPHDVVLPLTSSLTPAMTPRFPSAGPSPQHPRTSLRLPLTSHIPHQSHTHSFILGLNAGPFTPVSGGWTPGTVSASASPYRPSGAPAVPVSRSATTSPTQAAPWNPFDAPLAHVRAACRRVEGA